MEENLIIEEKRNENEFNLKDNKNNLKENSENQIKSSISKEQIKENNIDINIFSKLLFKIKNCLEENQEAKIKDKDNKRGSKAINNIQNNKKININTIITLLNELIDLISTKNINEENEKNLNLTDLSTILNNLQTTFYLNSEILLKIEKICNLIINNIKDNEQMEIFLEILVENLNYCDKKNNSDILINSLKIINKLLKNNSYFIDPIYDIIIPKIYFILDITSNDEIIQILCFKILILFICNNVFSYDLVSKGLLPRIKEVLYAIKIKNNYLKKDNQISENKIINNKINNNDSKENKIIITKENINDLKKQIFILLLNLTNVDTNLIKISDELMEILLDEFLNENYKEDQNINIKIQFFELLIEKEPKSIDIFIKYKGIESISKLLLTYEKNKMVILKLFHIISLILNYNKEYSKMMIKCNFHQYIKDIIDKLGSIEREVDFQGKSVLFLINFRKGELEKIEEYDIKEIKLNKSSMPPSYVINFLNNGKIVKIVNNHGEIKKKYLYFTPDFLKVMASKLNNVLPPKPKYIIETATINSVIKGYGTDFFKKSKRFYRALPEFNKCFSIIAFDPIEGEKSINIICEKESEVDKWINCIKIIIGYLQENKAINKNINFQNN